MKRVAVAACVMTIAWGAAIAMNAHAQDGDAFVDPLPPPVGFAFEESEDITNDDPDTTIARFGLDAAPWMPRVIAQMNEARGAGYTPDQIVLIDGAEGQRYLAIQWNGGVLVSASLEVYKVTALGEGQVGLTRVRTFDEEDYYSIYTPIGRPFAGEPAVLVVYWQVGMNRCLNGYRLIQLSGDTVDITPVQEPGSLEDLDGDGTAEAIISDDRLSAFCGVQDGAIPRIQRRVDGRFVDACADFPGQYAALRDFFRDDEDAADAVFEQAKPVFRQTREALILAQAGFVDVGIAYLKQMYATLPAYVLDYAADLEGWLLQYESPWIEFPVSLSMLLERARNASPGGCPVSEALDRLDREMRADPDLSGMGGSTR